VARRIHAAASGDAAPGISPGGAGLVERWLIAGVDLSMVPAPLDLDPLAHAEGPIRAWSKTGTDAGVRADMGVIWSDRGAVAYAAIATWDPREDFVAEAMRRMREFGAALAGRVR
jgi:beta-lactamase class A